MARRWVRGAKAHVGALVLGVAIAAAASGCAHLGAAPDASAPPAADSVTVALYHFDESGGRECADAGPNRLTATAGSDTRGEFGRFGSARIFTSSAESWAIVPYAAPLDVRHLTVEAWISPEVFGDAEDTPIAGRWSEYPNEQSWLFALVGSRRETRLGNSALPGFHESLVGGASPGRQMFAFKPAEPLPAQSFFSSGEIPLRTWTHVAASIDGEIVRFYVNDRLDSQYAVRATVRASAAPLLIGNYFDTRRLSGFSGDMRLGTDLGYPPVYAFRGAIDELRISSEAR